MIFQTSRKKWYGGMRQALQCSFKTLLGKELAFGLRRTCVQQYSGFNLISQIATNLINDCNQHLFRNVEMEKNEMNYAHFSQCKNFRKKGVILFDNTCHFVLISNDSLLRRCRCMESEVCERFYLTYFVFTN